MCVLMIHILLFVRLVVILRECLGSIIVCCYIDNLVESCQPSNSRGDLHLYADDAKVYSDNSQDLQNSLNNIINWLATHQLVLAPTKWNKQIKHPHLSIKRKKSCCLK